MLTKSKTVCYWEDLITSNKTLKGKIFENEPITKRTMYIHYVIFNKKSGLENVWAPIPDINKVLGFIQFCFLPEAYYKWIEGKKKVVTKIPTLSLDKLLKHAIENKRITKEEEEHIKENIEFINKLWHINGDKVIRELNKFCRTFNSNWLGDSNGFLYLRVFKNTEELGKFVVDSNIKTDYENKFEEKIGMTQDEWLLLCKDAYKDKSKERKFKNILFKQLKEVI